MPRLRRIRFQAIFGGLCRIGASLDETASILGCEAKEFEAWLDENPELKREWEQARAEAEISAQRLLRPHASRPTKDGLKAALALMSMPDDDRVEPPPPAPPKARGLSAEEVDRLSRPERTELLRLLEKMRPPA